MIKWYIFCASVRISSQDRRSHRSDITLQKHGKVKDNEGERLLNIYDSTPWVKDTVHVTDQGHILSP